MNKKIKEVIIQLIKLEILKIKVIGKINVISTSKIKKIMAIKKNWIEKGVREEFIMSNPHSNGEHFSRSKRDFFDSIEDNIIIIKEIKKIKKETKNNKKIIYTKN